MSCFMVGKIIASAKVLKVDPSGVLHLDINGNTVSLQSKHRIDRIVKKKNDTVNQLVVISSNPLQVAQYNYEDKLIDHYYNGFTPVIANWEPWYKLWAEEYKNQYANYSISSLESYRLLNNKADWYKLTSEDYVLPITGIKSVSDLTGKPIFYPNLPFDVKKLTNIPYCVAKSDGNSQSFPILYRAEAQDNNTSAVTFVIALYPFIIPYKWHFGIYKHMLGLATSTYEEEKDGRAWVELTGLDNTSSLKSFFGKCEIETNNQGKETDCNHQSCISKELFYRVHQKDSIKTFCSKYLEEVVTCFEEATTLSIEVGQVYNECAVLKIAGKKTLNGNQNIDEHLLLSGVCYQWGSDAFVHAHPVTLYRGKTPTTATLGSTVKKVLFSGTITQINRI